MFLLRLLVLAVPIALLGWAACHPYPYLLPVAQGSPAGFWNSAARGETIVPQDGWLYYSIGGLHGNAYYRVREADAFTAAPRSPEELGLHGELAKLARPAFEAWRKADPELADPRPLVIFLREKWQE